MEKNRCLLKVLSLFCRTSIDERFITTLNSFFTKKALTPFYFLELEIGLENNDIDLVVHSLKDLPSTLPENMVIGAIMERVDPRDTVIMKKDNQNEGTFPNTLDELPKGSILGTSAVRRGAQLRAAYPNLSNL